MARLTFLVALFLFLSNAFASTVTGTGFFITPDGFIVTNFHVIEGADQVLVRDSSGAEFKAEISLTDFANDIAILKVPTARQASLPFRASSDVKKGTEVFSIGYPNVSVQGKESKVTTGIISSLSGVGGAPSRFQISVPIQPGNSGGPLIDMAGTVVGVTTSKLSAAAMVKRGGTAPENVNYAVKSNYVLELIATEPSLARRIARAGQTKSLSLTAVVEKVEDAVVFIVATTQQESKRAISTRAPSDPLPPMGKVRVGQQCKQSLDCESENCFIGSCLNREGSVQVGEACNQGNECAPGLVCIQRKCRSL